MEKERLVCSQCKLYYNISFIAVEGKYNFINHITFKVNLFYEIGIAGLYIFWQAITINYKDYHCLYLKKKECKRHAK